MDDPNLPFLEKSQEILRKSQRWAARVKAEVRHRLTAEERDRLRPRGANGPRKKSWPS